MTDTTPTDPAALRALLAYQQADEEGIMVLTSRQAIHEVADDHRRLRAEAELLRGENEALRTGLRTIQITMNELGTLSPLQVGALSAVIDAALATTHPEGRD